VKWVEGGVTAARGFTAAGISAGIKRSRKPDLALVAAAEPVSAAAVFTANRVQAAPVALSRSRLRSGRARAVLINSGCANCMTGPAGHRDAETLTRDVARALAARERDILMASTGLIGTRLPLPGVRRAVPALVAQLHRARHADAAAAILTTDLQIKEAAVEGVIGGRKVRVGGMA
jgi:glutamate N-acetyltransferase/amino-acid N-acetyltransferase